MDISFHDAIKERLIKEFAGIFGDSKGVSVFFAPGRVNLIGEHTDYNGGHVLPCALTIGTYAVVRIREDDLLNMYSVNFPDDGITTGKIGELVPRGVSNWSAYPKGMIYTFAKEGMSIEKGLDMLVYGNIPNGSGLSSSASIEMLMGHILREMYGFEFDNVKLALLGQKSENEFNGVKCGIMDQFAISMGKDSSAIFLNTNTMEYEYVPVDTGDAVLIIACTNKKRGLGDSKYNERRSECEQALELINKETGRSLNGLCELSVEEFDSVSDCIKDAVIKKRAKHAVYEDARTVSAVRMLASGDLKGFGELMTSSHISLKDDYEVTGDELDTIVEEALKCDGVYGARMTGAGFGGCSVNLVKKSYADDFIKNVGAGYKSKIGYDASFYIVNIGNGPINL